MKMHHIGILADDLSKEVDRWALFGMKPISSVYYEKAFETNNIMLSDGVNKIELIEPVGEKHFSVKKLTNRIYHISYLVSDIEDMIKLLRESHYIQMTDIGYSECLNKKVVFMISPGRYIIELLEDVQDESGREG